MRGVRFFWAALAAAMLAGCGGSGSGLNTPPASPTPKGPASAEITFAGDPALATPLTRVSVLCLEPSLDGMTIQVSGVPQGQPQSGLFVLLRIRGGIVSVRVNTGSGAQYQERDFMGKGTINFDAGAGVQLGGSLTETTAAGTNQGVIGAITSISGSVSCGNQTAGTSTLRVTGTTKLGPIDAVLRPVRVVCSSGSSYFVGVTGLAAVGATPAFVSVTIGQSSLQFFLVTRSANEFFSAMGEGGTTTTTTGGHVDGNSHEGSNTVHITGDATCGSSTTY